MVVEKGDILHFIDELKQLLKIENVFVCHEFRESLLENGGYALLDEFLVQYGLQLFARVDREKFVDQIGLESDAFLDYVKILANVEVVFEFLRIVLVVVLRVLEEHLLKGVLVVVDGD